jgi:drug/metabolite transporter (DMT)-like permease
MQFLLFNADAGAIMGFDGRVVARERSLLVAARAEHRAPNRRDRWWLGGLSGALFVISIYAFAHGTDFTPAGSVTDPALVLGVVTALSGLMLLISSLRPTTTIMLDLSDRLANLESARR